MLLTFYMLKAFRDCQGYQVSQVSLQVGKLFLLFLPQSVKLFLLLTFHFIL